METSGTKQMRGFAVMDQEVAESIRRKGGQTISSDRSHMAEIGRRGGKNSRRGYRKRHMYRIAEAEIFCKS